MHACQSAVSYEQRNPAATQLYKVISENLNSFLAERSEEGRSLPKFIVREFESYLRCGIFAHGFGRVQCGCCQHEKLVPYSCDRRKSLWDKGRGFCPSCGARRMSEAGKILRTIAQIDVEFSNSMIEALLRSLKHRWLCILYLPTFEAVCRAVDGYLIDHNNRIPHDALGGAMPLEVFSGTWTPESQSLLAEAAAKATFRRMEFNRSQKCGLCPP